MSEQEHCNNTLVEGINWAWCGLIPGHEGDCVVGGISGPVWRGTKPDAEDFELTLTVKELRQIKAEAWAAGLKVGWEATSSRVHYDWDTGYMDVPRFLKKRNPFKEKK